MHRSGGTSPHRKHSPVRASIRDVLGAPPHAQVVSSKDALQGDDELLELLFGDADLQQVPPKSAQPHEHNSPTPQQKQSKQKQEPLEKEEEEEEDHEEELSTTQESPALLPEDPPADMSLDQDDIISLLEKPQITKAEMSLDSIVELTTDSDRDMEQRRQSRRRKCPAPEDRAKRKLRKKSRYSSNMNRHSNKYARKHLYYMRDMVLVQITMDRNLNPSTIGTYLLYSAKSFDALIRPLD